ncbi:hypothetical protein SELMODRAFT_444080 [Selaginella moellendorffii]|uniref:Uncharacterized protein n=1 Tax=Selaginella moellendorffii TaxID=88036 RepID=D8S6B3_SELML|nr:ankyrin repeat-containing protein P16F5.05c [Selaginella moellendorffii]EFJ19912.1 hypothetical protein SELMODRAFT_444080 [Selaginella moellendorffii]|eukprot:XP_002978955.1 ankyrin repeat-containing protein P16F5.05c [Selaginella moellendorffii]
MGRVLPASEEPPPAQECEFDVDDLLQAARYGELEEVKLVAPLLPQNSHNEQGCTALHMASANGHLSIVKYLIERGENVNACNAENNTPLHWAALNGQVQVVEELIASGASASALNRYDRTPVDEALSRGKQEVVNAIAILTAAASMDDTSIQEEIN